ncbi:MAG: AbrB/MazE/SpoVT family DNA-binding domain-containing protein [Alphaproteobacteria bacterium]|nr:AbrB/MazE/SpoVT family DNA-binding domain-containing protein [Alphaproteobacteria bacterium]
METVKSYIDKNGRLHIPASFRKVLHLEPGEEVLLYQEGAELKVRTFKQSLTRARQLVKQYNTENLDLVSLLLESRREEAKKDV